MKFLALLGALVVFMTYASSVNSYAIASDVGPVTSLAYSTGRLESITKTGTRLSSAAHATSISTMVGVPARADTPPCEALVQDCYHETVGDNPTGEYGTAFHKWSCAMAFACRAVTEGQSVDGLIAELFGVKGASATQELRFGTNLFNQISTDKKVWTQQNFIDGYYTRLQFVGGPYPPDVSYVIAYWKNILAWTGFCASGNVPYNNLADWFQYSSTVKGAASQC